MHAWFHWYEHIFNWYEHIQEIYFYKHYIDFVTDRLSCFFSFLYSLHCMWLYIADIVFHFQRHFTQILNLQVFILYMDSLLTDSLLCYEFFKMGDSLANCEFVDTG